MTAAGLPRPLVPPGLVLPGIERAAQVVIDVDYLDGSLPRHAGAFLVAFRLYASAFKECPTGSLPSDEACLRALIPAEDRDVDWTRVAEVLSTRWILCADGRLYRPQLAESVLTTWLELALMPAAVDVMAKAALLAAVVESLRRLKPRAEILDRVAAASGGPPRPDLDDLPSDDYDAISAVAAGDLARNGLGGIR